MVLVKPTPWKQSKPVSTVWQTPRVRPEVLQKKVCALGCKSGVCQTVETGLDCFHGVGFTNAMETEVLRIFAWNKLIVILESKSVVVYDNDETATRLNESNHIFYEKKVKQWKMKRPHKQASKQKRGGTNARANKHANKQTHNKNCNKERTNEWKKYINQERQNKRNKYRNNKLTK